jgi:hypothetical protein
LLAFDIDDVSIATASATDSIFFDLVGVRPVLVFLDTLLLILSGLLKVRDTGELAGRGVGWAMLDSGVPVAEITEVVNIARCEEGTSGEGVNRSVTPLHETVSTHPVITVSIITYPFIPETATSVHHGEKVFVFFAAEPIQAGNFEITPEMAHIIALAFHSLRVDILQIVVTGFSLQNFVGQFVLLATFGWNLWLLWLLQEHLPQTLGLQIILAFVCGCIPENVGDCLSELLHCNSEAVGLVGFGHLEEWVTEMKC